MLSWSFSYRVMGHYGILVPMAIHAHTDLSDADVCVSVDTCVWLLHIHNNVYN